MQQTISLLKLRCIQLFRLLKETGFGITILAIFLLTGVLLQFIATLLAADPAFAIIGAGATTLIIDNLRKDKQFVNQIFGSKKKTSQYLFIEYTIPFLPLVIYKLIIRQYLIAIGILTIIMIISLISPYLSKPVNQGYKKNLSIIPLKFFELKFFAEKRTILITTVLILLFSGLIHVSLWILGLVLMLSFILEMLVFQEPIEMIHWKEGFVRNKITSYILLFIPILMLSGLLAYSRSDLSIWVFIYGVIAILVAIALGISNKYAEYYGFTEKLPSSMPMTIMVFMMLMPGFIIITISYTVMKYIKAEKQMKQLCSK